MSSESDINRKWNHESDRDKNVQPEKVAGQGSVMLHAAKKKPSILWRDPQKIQDKKRGHSPCQNVVELTHMFYQELSIGKDNIFLADLAKNNEIEQVAFKKSKGYAVSSLSINQDTTAHISLPNLPGQKALSDILRTYSEEKKSLT